VGTERKKASLEPPRAVKERGGGGVEGSPTESESTSEEEEEGEVTLPLLSPLRVTPLPFSDNAGQ
jgi:hypothetical protein